MRLKRALPIGQRFRFRDVLGISVHRHYVRIFAATSRHVRSHPARVCYCWSKDKRWVNLLDGLIRQLTSSDYVHLSAVTLPHIMGLVPAFPIFDPSSCSIDDIAGIKMRVT
jgi:hypothetical protein